MEIYSSLISCDILNLARTMVQIQSYCSGYHIDVMDDHFVPNLTWGPMFVNAILQNTTHPLDVHLMVSQPERWFSRVMWRSQDTMIVHYEAITSVGLLSFLKSTKSIVCKKGVALKPNTPIDSIESSFHDIDHVLIMSVEPGFSGQVFMPCVVDKIKKLCVLRDRNHFKFSIGVDGGVDLSNIKMLADLGVDKVGVASAIFSKKDPVEALKILKENC